MSALASRLVRRVAGLALAGHLLAAGSAPAEEFDCLIQPWRMVTVSAAIEGVVEEVLIERGDRVEKGQVVARLESQIERAGVAVARARAEARGEIISSEARRHLAERELERQTRLLGEKMISDSEMDDAVATAEIARAELLRAQEARSIAEHELERALANLERRTIRSPVDGVVVERILSPGEYADPPQIAKLAQIDPLRVESFVPLRLFGRIEPGSEAEVRVTSPHSQGYRANVVAVDRVVNPASGTFGVQLELPNPELALVAGVNCRVAFTAEGHDGLADLESPTSEDEVLP